MQLIEKLLKNRFKVDTFEQSYVDCASHNSLVFLSDGLGVDGICARGLLNIRCSMTKPGLKLLLRPAGSQHVLSFSGSSLQSGVKGVEQRASVACGGQLVSGTLRCVAGGHNVYRFLLELSTEGAELDFTLLADGAWEKAFTVREFREKEGCIKFAASDDNAKNQGLSNVKEEWAATWRWSRAGTPIGLEPSRPDSWILNLGPCQVQSGAPLRIDLTLEVENRSRPARFAWRGAPKAGKPFEQVESDARDRTLSLMEKVQGRERASYARELRAAMVLARCEYKGVHGRWGDNAASFCLVTSWASTAFFWDSLFGALGLDEISPPLAEQAVLTLFPFQRPDGAVPMHSYEYAHGSTFYPQAPLLAWCVTRLLLKRDNRAFLKEMLPKMRGVFDWFTLTQDHDRDGLVEVRFTGQIADNGPQYDRYVAHIRGAHTDGWNAYLSPAASVAMNSFLYMDGMLLARLYRLVGDDRNADLVEQRVAAIPDLLVKHCWDESTGFFHDYDHHVGDFNRCRVLTSMLPLWARMPLPQRIKDILLDDNLLSEKRFFGPPPFPYVARDDAHYDPEGYWRGRIWPHTTTWMLEALWQEGRRQEADLAADRLIAMIDREMGIRENYFSGQQPGGGSIDYQWSAATYLYLCNRRYREDVFRLFY